MAVPIITELMETSQDNFIPMPKTYF